MAAIKFFSKLPDLHKSQMADQEPSVQVFPAFASSSTKSVALTRHFEWLLMIPETAKFSAGVKSGNRDKLALLRILPCAHFDRMHVMFPSKHRLI